MGKTKTKYPLDIIIQFCLINSDNSYLQKEVVLNVHSSPLTYENIKGPYQQFLHENQISYQTIMECQIGDQPYQFDQNFSLQIPKLFQNCGNRLCIIVRSFLQTIKQQIDAQLQQIRNDIGQIYKRINDLPTRQQFEQYKKTASLLPVLTHGTSSLQPIYEQKQLDLGVLFSEPIFDESRKKTATPPVDFRSQIQRLHLALKSSMKSNITLKCEIATRQNLKHLIKYSKPKILHFICHGTKEGSLQFEDDSRAIVGTLQIIKKQDILSILKTVAENLPQIVFINSCYSQHIGQIFYNIGVKYVIMIDSEDKIEDQAAQIFSEHFYRNIFSGQKVGEAFKDSKQRVKIKHNSFGCCCRHSSKEKHKQNCRWTKVIKKQFTQIQGHRLFHVPSQLCQCQLRNLNRHKLTCQWAKQALFNINNDFRIKDTQSQTGQFRFPKKTQLPKYLPKDELVICCCFNYEGSLDQTQFRLPHSQSNKFKMLPDSQSQKTDSVFEIIPSNYKQLIDYTAPELIQTHQKIDTSILGRQQEIFQFMKKMKQLNQNIFIIYGPLGVGRTSFALKSTTYLIQRKCFQMYFYIDLYDIKDRDIFRYKFNQITKFNYNGQIRLTQVKNKMVIIILDNADQFLVHQKDQLYQELKNLRSQLHKSKIIITFKEETCLTFDFQKIHAEKFHLQALSNNMATRLIFSKMRHLFDISVDHSQVYALVAKNQTLRIPKIIESVCQSFSTTKKIKAEDIRKKLEQIGDYDFASNKLIQQNLKLLQQKSQQSYDLLLFISQFSEGISREDFKILSLYQKKDSYIHLPIGKNWEQNFTNLFQKYKFQKDSIEKDANTDASSVATEEQSEVSIPNPLLKNTFSYEYPEMQSLNSDIKIEGKFIKGESYFLDQMSPNRFIVKRYIRDFIWKKHVSQSNYYMKHLFVGYMSVMLEIYFKKLIEQNYVHQELLQCSSLSQTGIFSIKSNVFNINASLTESVRFAKQYTSQFQKIISEHPTIKERIKKTDPSIFILNHKQDFLNIYQKDWDAVLLYLKSNKQKEEKILLTYLENLVLFVPTAFKVAKVQPSLLRYVLSKSMNLLSRLKSYSQQKKILILTLKLQLMKVTLQIQKFQPEELNANLQFNKEYNIKMLQKLDKGTLQTLKMYWDFQKRFILMYKQYSTKQMKSSLIEKGKYSSEKLKSIIQNLKKWLQEDWSQADPLLYAKRNLLISLMYLNFIKNSSGSVGSHTFVLKFKKQYQKKIIDIAVKSSKTLQNNQLMKLCLRAKLTAIQLFWLYTNSKKKSKQQKQNDPQFYQDLSQRQREILQCQQIFTTKKNNLIGFMQFQSEIKYLKKQMKNKLWQQSQNTIVFMRSVPVTSNGELPIIQHLARKKNKFRKQIEKVVDLKIDLCTKFQILTKQKLKQELTDGCTILLMSTDIKLRGGKIYIVFQGDVMNEDLVQINQEFVQMFSMQKIKILILAGKNTDHAITRLAALMKNPPIMISLSSKSQQEQFQQFEEFNHQQDQDYLDSYLLKYQQRKKSQISFVKQFIKNLLKISIKSKQDINELVKKSNSNSLKDLQIIIQSKNTTAPIFIQHVKGTYKDLSPGHQKNNNIFDMNHKLDATNFIVLRRYKQTFRVLKYLRKYYNSEPVYVNIFGDLGSGKSCFVKQIARILVQREFYQGGIYLIQGKILEKKYNGQFQAYFSKQSQTGKILNLEDFQKNGNKKFLLIIDDFHLIKPRSNGRFNLFLQKIIQMEVNLIIVTHQMYKKQTFNKIKPIKIDRLSQFEINLIAYNTLDLKNKQMMDSFQELKRKKHGNVDVKQIFQLKHKFMKGKQKEQLPEKNSKDFKKMVSNQA